jgi:hypothetical protein
MKTTEEQSFVNCGAPRRRSPVRIGFLMILAGYLLAAGEAAPAVERVVVWDGEQATKGAGWANPKGSTVGPQTVEAHSGNTSVEYKFKSSGEEWPGAGWNWCAFQTGAYGTDITHFKTFTFWMKTKGRVADVQLNLLCNGKEFDMPEHHTGKVSALNYCPQLLDGQWHKVSIPLADLTQPKGFDPLHVGELQIFNAGEGEGSFFIDDIAFEDPAGDKPSATAAPTRPETAAAVRTSDEMLANGSFADGISNWVIVAESGATGQAEVVSEGPDGRAALRLKVLTIAELPWRLQFYQTGMRVEKGKTYVLTFWAKSDRPGSITVNCMQNHEPWDHHTQEKLPVSTAWQPMRFTFVAPWADDNVRISFTDLGTAAGQVYWFANCSLVSLPGAKTSAAPMPATSGAVSAPSAAFIWKGDCSSEGAFVNSDHPTIPGHYEYLPDPKAPARGLVFAGHLTPDFTTTDPEKFHLHPDIYFDRFLPGNITLSFDVKVADLAPSELGPYAEHPWLNVVTLFDETTRAGGANFHPSVMVNLVGTPEHYRLQAYSIDSKGAGMFFDKLENAPAFPTGKWVTVRVEADVNTRRVRVYQDNALTSTGPYLGKPGLAGAHMGLYANRKMTRATVFNDNITISVGD